MFEVLIKTQKYIQDKFSFRSVLSKKAEIKTPKFNKMR